MVIHPILDIDSYKFSHFNQLPPGTSNMFHYFESRGGDYPATVFFGLQYILEKYLSMPINVEHVDEAEAIATEHGLPFNTSDWLYIAEELGGRLPVRIRAVPEGSIVPTSNVLFTVENTDPRLPWLPGWLETMLVRVWYPTTVATRSFYLRKEIEDYIAKTSDDPTQIAFKLHDFGSRGVSSQESAGIGGMAHLVNFMGTDTVAALVYAQDYYQEAMAGYSIPAMEHSTVTAWGKESEVYAFSNMLDLYGKKGSLLACVSDTYDLWTALDMWGTELKQKVIDSGATVVIRPDSGDPVPTLIKTLFKLELHFGSKLNSKGYKVLNNVRVIYGDGMNEFSIREALYQIAECGFAVDNVAFGMGGGLLQKLDRDTAKFAYKCSAIVDDGQHRGVSKNPSTDPGKKSKEGRLDLIRSDEGYSTVEVYWGMKNVLNSAMHTVFENGVLTNQESLSTIRQRLHKSFVQCEW